MWLVIQSVLFGFLMLANFVFLAGIDVAWITIKRIYGENFILLLYAHIILYVSVYVITTTFKLRVP